MKIAKKFLPTKVSARESKGRNIGLAKFVKAENDLGYLIYLTSVVFINATTKILNPNIFMGPK